MILASLHRAGLKFNSERPFARSLHFRRLYHPFFLSSSLVRRQFPRFFLSSARLSGKMGSLLAIRRGGGVGIPPSQRIKAAGISPVRVLRDYGH